MDTWSVYVSQVSGTLPDQPPGPADAKNSATPTTYVPGVKVIWMNESNG